MRHLHPAARRRSLFSLITTLVRGCDPSALAACQAAIDRLGLRYCLASPAGRREFCADLAAAGSPLLTPDQKKRARRCITAGAGLCENGDPFDLFSREYAERTFGDVPAGPAALPFGGALAAVSLAGLIIAGCAQKKQTEAVPLPQPVLRVLPPQEPLRQYTVQPGDSVYRIARQEGVNQEDVVRLNNLRYDQTRRWYVLHPGQVLRLPDAERSEAGRDDAAVSEQMALRRSADHEEAAPYHLVHKGETLGRIAKKYGVSVRDLAAANAIDDPGKIRFGMMLKIPRGAETTIPERSAFKHLSSQQKVAFLAQRTIPAGRPYLQTLVEACEAFNIDPRLYAALVWEESWFDGHAVSQDNCRRLVQLDPRFHTVSKDVRENFEKSLRYLRQEFAYYLRKGFDRKSATICALAAYNGGTTRIRRFITSGAWDGRDAATIPLRETKDYVARVLNRCEHNYHAVL